MIAHEVEAKTAEEIKEYAQVFWERYQEIAGASILAYLLLTIAALSLTASPTLRSPRL
jgi:hypothetical protein